MENDFWAMQIRIAMSEQTDIIKQTISILCIDSPLGNILAGAAEQGICLLEFREQNNLDMSSTSRQLNANIEEGDSVHFASLIKQLNEYFEGRRKIFDVPLLMLGTAFQQEVWQQLLTIPYGSTRSYKEQSMTLNKVDAIRAVAGANGANRIAILIPCHRVIGGDGSLTGYAGGLWRKKWLLDLEQGQLTMPSR